MDLISHITHFHDVSRLTKGSESQLTQRQLSKSLAAVSRQTELETNQKPGDSDGWGGPLDMSHREM